MALAKNKLRTVVAELNEMEKQKELDHEKQNLKSLIEEEVLHITPTQFFLKLHLAFLSAARCSGDRKTDRGSP